MFKSRWAISALMVCVALLLFGIVQPCNAQTFFDDFNDGNLDGWTIVTGNWRVENQMLLQDQPGDGFIALVQNLSFSSQSAEVQLYMFPPAGYGGITLWYQDSNNYVAVRLYPAAAPNQIWIHDVRNGVDNLFMYPYDALREETWYRLRVDANSQTGALAVYIDDKYLFTHTVTTDIRTGPSGLYSGNSGGYFDNFSVTGEAILNLDSFKIVNNKQSGKTTTSMSGTIPDLPQLNLSNGSTVNARITIELFNALPGGDNIVVSGETTLNVKDTNKTLTISK